MVGMAALIYVKSVIEKILGEKDIICRCFQIHTHQLGKSIYTRIQGKNYQSQICCKNLRWPVVKSADITSIYVVYIFTISTPIQKILNLNRKQVQKDICIGKIGKKSLKSVFPYVLCVTANYMPELFLCSLARYYFWHGIIFP